MPESSRAKRRTTDVKNNRRGNLRTTNGNLEVTYRVTGTTTTQTTTKTYTYTYETTTTQETVTNTNTFTLNVTTTDVQLGPSDVAEEYATVYYGSPTNPGEITKARLDKATGVFNGPDQAKLTGETLRLLDEGPQGSPETLVSAPEATVTDNFSVSTPQTNTAINAEYVDENYSRRIYANINGFDGTNSYVDLFSLKFTTYRTTTTTTTTTVTNTITNTFTNTNTNTNTFSTTTTTTKSATLI